MTRVLVLYYSSYGHVRALAQAEAEGARVEISRRLIAATHRAERSGTLTPAPRGPTGMVAGMLLIGVPALGALVYFSVGVPGAPDRPFAGREQPTSRACSTASQKKNRKQDPGH